MSRLLLRGGRVIDPAPGIDGLCDVLVLDGEIDALEPPGRLGIRRGRRDARRDRMLGGARTDRSARASARSRLSRRRKPSRPDCAPPRPAASPRSPRWRTPRRSTTRPKSTRYMLEQAREVHATRLVPVSAVTKGSRGRELVDFAAMAAAGARLFSDDGIPIDDQAVLARAIGRRSRGWASRFRCTKKIARSPATARSTPAKSPSASAWPAFRRRPRPQRVRRDLAIAIGADAPVHIAHVSTALSRSTRSARPASAARNVTCEATPHHFTLDDRAVLRCGPNAKMAPPLRSARDVEAMRSGDRRRHDRYDRDRSCAARSALEADGSAGRAVSARDAIAGRLTRERGRGADAGRQRHGRTRDRAGPRARTGPSRHNRAARMVEMMSLKPRAVACVSTAGTLAPGARADITVIDPNLEWTVDPAKFISKSRNTPFTGRRLKGRAIVTDRRGRTSSTTRRIEGADVSAHPKRYWLWPTAGFFAAAPSARSARPSARSSSTPR